MKKQLYFWHKWIGAAACVIVFAWSLSGFLHPIMSWTQPRPAQMFFAQNALLAASDFKISLADALRQNKIENFKSLNTVTFDGETFYQIEREESAPLAYLNARTGKIEPDGDSRFAATLARYYVGDETSAIKEINFLTDFSPQYKSNNRLLPVYEVKFDRADRLTAYVDTAGARLATLNNNRKLWFQWLFVNLHNLEFFGVSAPLRIFLMMILMSVTFAAALSGLLVYLVFWKHFRSRAEGNSRLLWRKYHRMLGVVVALTTMSWSLSGAFHAFNKLDGDGREVVRVENQFSLADLPLAAPAAALAQAKEPNGFSLVKIGTETFYRLRQTNQQLVFVNARTGEIEPDGEMKLAKQIANTLSHLSDKDIVSVAPVTKFGGEYGFINKRLPVMRVAYCRNSDVRYYVETASGALGAKVNNQDVLEGYSFAYLHKWNFLDPIGKILRDALMMTWALLNTIVAALGVRLFFWQRKRLR
jgi:uncharacterized iron-regulated membrane protein